jgi:hypothetical protein
MEKSKLLNNEMWRGEQGPFADWVDQFVEPVDMGTGWIYWKDQRFCRVCGEQLQAFAEGAFCPHCETGIPQEWERQHEDALVLAVGGMLTKGRMA